MELEAFRHLGQRRLRRFPACLGDRSDDERLIGELAARAQLVDGSDLAAGRSDGPLEVRRLGVEHPVQVPAQGSRHLAGLDLEERCRSPDPPQEQPDGFAVLPRHDAAAASEPPRRGQPDVAEPPREQGRFPSANDELEVRPAAGQAERAAGEDGAG